ncbi:hypothetical protein K474DRAFT_1713911 [Panus rudis PR-1116 ss-1]|nr:hypothetical protein K474DRAFT_1713911 [Panus rudis PR-1116 ss-1]
MADLDNTGDNFCKPCKRQLRTFRGWRSHIGQCHPDTVAITFNGVTTTVHRNPDFTYTCFVCKNNLVTDTALIEHFKKHEGQKNMSSGSRQSVSHSNKNHRNHPYKQSNGYPSSTSSKKVATPVVSSVSLSPAVSPAPTLDSPMPPAAIAKNDSPTQPPSPTLSYYDPDPAPMEWIPTEPLTNHDMIKGSDAVQQIDEDEGNSVIEVEKLTQPSGAFTEAFGIERQASRLFQDPDFLEQIDCYLHLDYRYLSCHSCEHAILPAYLWGHLKEHGIVYNQEEFNELLEDFIIEHKVRRDAAIPTPPPEGRPVEGIELEDGYLCQARDCHFACTSLKYMRNHISKEHGKNGLECSALIKATSVQTFFLGSHRKYFAVNGHLPLIGDIVNIPYEVYLAEIYSSSEDIPPPSNTSKEDLPRHVQYTGWDDVMKDYRNDPDTRRTILSLMQHPSPDMSEPIICRIPALVRKYFEYGYTVGKKASNFILRMLQEYPVQHESTAGWKFNLNEETRTRYARIVSIFVVYILRAMHDKIFVMQLMPKDIEYGKQLYDALAEQPSHAPIEKTVDILHQFLYSLLSRETRDIALDRWRCNITSFLALWALRADGGYQSEDNYSQVLAMWSYAYRLVHMIEAYKHEHEYEDGWYG